MKKPYCCGASTVERDCLQADGIAFCETRLYAQHSQMNKAEMFSISTSIHNNFHLADYEYSAWIMY